MTNPVSIKISQPGNPGITGQSRDDLITGSLVTAVDTANPFATGSYLWTFIDKPSGSSATLAGTTTVSASFTPDVHGTYLLHLNVNGAQTGSAGGAIKELNRLFRVPAAGETTEYGVRGWANAIDNLMDQLDHVVGAQNEKFINKVFAAGRESHSGSTALIAGGFSFNPTEYVVTPASSSFVFSAVGALSSASIGVTGSVKLRNVTDAEDVVTLDFTSTALSKKEVTLVTGSTAGNLKTSEKLYEIRMSGSATIAMELYSAELRVTNTVK